MGVVDLALVRFSLRQALGRHRLGRWAFLGFLVVLPALVALVVLEAGRWDPELAREWADREFRQQFLRGLFEGVQLPLLFPLIVLLLMVPALREEIDGDTLPYLWIAPLSRGAIVLSKFVGAWVGAVLLVGMSTVLAAAVAVPDAAVLGKLLLAALPGAAAYGALFLLLGVWVPRALLGGIAYVIGWEELFSRVSEAASQLSVRHYAVAVERALLGEPSDVTLGTALGVLLGLTVVALVLAVWRFAQMEFPGGEEA